MRTKIHKTLGIGSLLSENEISASFQYELSLRLLKKLTERSRLIPFILNTEWKPGSQQVTVCLTAIANS